MQPRLDAYDPRSTGNGGEGTGSISSGPGPGSGAGSSASSQGTGPGGASSSGGTAASGGSGGSGAVGGAPAGSGGLGGLGGLGGDGGTGPVDLVAAYNFDEGSGITVHDATANGNDGQLVEALWVPGKNGGALAFDGDNDVVRVPGDPSWEEDGLSVYTFEAWIKAKEGGSYHGGVTVGSWANQVAALLVQSDGWLFRIGTVDGPMGWICTAGTGPLPFITMQDGEFHHIAGVLDVPNGGCGIYVDGVLMGWDIYVDGTTSFLGGDLMFGGFDGSNFLASEIDDVRIYKRALTEAEIQLDMMLPVAP